jgi:hypothetical protein
MNFDQPLIESLSTITVLQSESPTKETTLVTSEELEYNHTVSANSKETGP